jgi:DNA-binding IclR family transcriptional regulator
MSGGAPRIVEVLDLISKQPNGVSVTELSRMLNITKASASRMLAGFVEAGLLERDAAQRHTPGLRLWTLGARALQCFRPAEIARPIIYEASQRHGIGIYLATARGSTIYYIEQVGPEIALNMPIHTVLPIHACSPGKAILAFSSDDFIELVLSKPLPRLTKHTITTREGMEQEIAEIKRRGFSVNRGEAVENALGIAVPIFDHTGRPVASIGNACAPEEFGEEYIARMAPVVIEIGSALSRALGYTTIGLRVG